MVDYRDNNDHKYMSRPAIFITGAAVGIGRATAELFAARGWFVGLFDIDDAGVEKLARELPAGASVAGKLDVSDAAAMESALARFWEASGGRLDLMFNNAGIVAVDDFEAIPLSRHHRLIDVNFKGMVNGCYAAFPYLKKTPGARLLSMSSASGIYGSPAFALYSATKFGVRGLTEALNIEWDRHGILVMDVMPLFVNTPLVQGFGSTPKSVQRLGLRLQASDIAHTAWKAATRPRWLAPVHWYPGLQTFMFHLTVKLMPSFVNRFSTKLVSGY